MAEKRKNEFEELLEQSFQKRKKITAGASFNVTIVDHKNGYLFIRSGDGTNGIIPEEEYKLTDEPVPAVKSEIEAWFLRENHGDYIFTVCINPDELNQDLIEAAFNSQIPVAGHVIAKIKGGYNVKLGTSTAFCPESQLDNELKDNWTGKVLKFIITEVQKNSLVVSQKKLVEKAREQSMNFLKDELKEGSFVTVKVKSVHSFGLIVDLNGMDAMIPKSEATYQKGNELDFKPGETLKAKVIGLNWPENKITLTVKDFIQDPWLAKIPYREGEVVEGRVESIKPFGVFVRLNDSFTGLVPNRESGLEDRSPLASHFKPGDMVEVFIMEINPERRQIGLSLKKASEIKSRMEYQQFLGGDNSSTSSLGDILKKALNDSQSKKK